LHFIFFINPSRYYIRNISKQQKIINLKIEQLKKIKATKMLFLQKLIKQRSFSSKANEKRSVVFVKPLIKYANPDQDKVSILADNRNKAGIYRWINNLNGNTYVGSSINLSVRFYTYYSIRCLTKSNRPIERALLKHGYSNFSLEILEYCSPDNLLKREQFYLDNLKPKYNIVERAGSTLGYKHTDESLKKMKDFILSDLVMAKKKLATENATSSIRIPIFVKNIKTGEIIHYKSLVEAAKAIGVTRGAVSQALLSNRILKKKYYIEKTQS
jgi:GIY-YIG catalytic domain